MLAHFKIGKRNLPRKGSYGEAFFRAVLPSIFRKHNPQLMNDNLHARARGLLRVPAVADQRRHRLVELAGKLFILCAV